MYTFVFCFVLVPFLVLLVYLLGIMCSLVMVSCTDFDNRYQPEYSWYNFVIAADICFGESPWYIELKDSVRSFIQKNIYTKQFRVLKNVNTYGNGTVKNIFQLQERTVLLNFISLSSWAPLQLVDCGTYDYRANKASARQMYELTDENIHVLAEYLEGLRDTRRIKYKIVPVCSRKYYNSVNLMPGDFEFGIVEDKMVKYMGKDVDTVISAIEEDRRFNDKIEYNNSIVKTESYTM